MLAAFSEANRIDSTSPKFLREFMINIFRERNPKSFPRPRFTLRGMLFFVATVAVPLSLIMSARRESNIQRDIAHKLQETGAANHVIFGHPYAQVGQEGESFLENLYWRISGAVVGKRPAIALIESEIGDLEGISRFSNLQSLRIKKEANVRDISPLVNLKKLKILVIEGPEVQNWSPLFSITSVQALNCEDIRVPTSLSAISNLQSLSGLTLADCPGITTLAGIENAATLRSLYLRNVGISEIEPAARLKGLVSLWLINLPIEDIQPIAQLSQLEYLRVIEARVRDWSPVFELSKLKELTCGFVNTETDISPISNLSSLRELRFVQCPGISDIGGIEQLTCLSRLVLQGTKVSNVTPIAHVASLTHLELVDQPTTDLQSLFALSRLKSLNISGTSVTNDIITIRKFTNLERLYVNVGQLTDAELDTLRSLRPVLSVLQKKNP